MFFSKKNFKKFRYATYANIKAVKVGPLRGPACNVTKVAVNKLSMLHAPKALDFFVKKLEITKTMSNIVVTVITTIKES